MNSALPAFFMAAALFCSCTDRDEGKVKNAAVTVNDILIDYNQCGNGDTTLLYVHGWCINKEYWSEQAKYFCDRYNVVAIDLPGFGKSGKNRDSWLLEQYADDIKNL